ncbi:2-deoxy-D-gluconate 3-dehydrogenase (plasmid) [Paraburkholderia phytofirmans OLGA172]|uniref:2-deoxy-D-gluconate 3-dehydrogenase n=1 Tax=Paraburkholderia phytofirmans OLGA172 TaxID=1417228 RepID=A0A160FX96_9BURK|nr:SDR family NAD(P)-dependent oxidoreductase [Paraburkholderia phytofirmans]ANB77816.1 2-deoxy-D-gluconate 3-dehydrogenase [Paraburkholderia phytofirmans OLGA172]
MSYASIFSLSGRAALITGASSGIGLHMATTMAEAGAKVVLCARRSDRIEQAAANLREQGLQAYAVTLDVTQPSTFDSAWALAQEKVGQPIDILFNNAGILYTERFIDQTPEQVSAVFDTDLKGAFLLAQVAARSMIGSGGGSIINVASTAGLRAGGSLSSYGAAKAGLVHLTRVMALELASKNIRVNAICPGNFETDMHASFEEKGFAETIRQRIPMKKFGKPHQLDGSVLLLASDAGGFITGVCLPVDGGQVLSWM